MTSKSLPLVDLKADLRSAPKTRVRRGLLIKILRVLTLFFLDTVAIVAAWNLAVLYGTPFDAAWTERPQFIILVIALELGVMLARGLYKPGGDRRNFLGLIKALSLSEIFLLLITFIYEPHSHISRSTFLLFWLFSLLFVCTGRYIFDVSTKIIRKRGAICYPVCLITDDVNQDVHLGFLQKENCYKVLHIDNPRCLDRSNREQTFEYLRSQGIVEAFVSWSAIKNRLYVCWNFQTNGINLRILPPESEINYPKSILGMADEVHCMAIPAPIIAGGDFWVKRCFDLVCGLVLLFLLSPVYVAIAILIKLDSPGPVFFQQNRVGLHSKNFKIWKFRTMVSNAEKLQASLEAKNEIKDGVLFKLKDDPRITKVGKFLRRYSLDELPQIFNVLLGEMSLVGPRPLPTRDVERFDSAHFIRQEVLPGITGLWQVSGRSNIDNFEDAVKLDIQYIENWSLLLDMKILLKTVQVVLHKTGAY